MRTRNMREWVFRFLVDLSRKSRYNECHWCMCNVSEATKQTPVRRRWRRGNEITFWGVNMMLGNCLMCQKWKSWRSNQKKHHIGKQVNPFSMFAANCKTQQNSFLALSCSCSMFLSRVQHARFGIRSFFVSCFQFSCHYMTMPDDDLLIVIFHLFCLQSMCKCF